MNSRRLWLSGSVLVALLVQTQAASGNLIDDTYGAGAGSFELGAFVDSGGFMRLAPGSGPLTGWTIGGNGVDWMQAPYARATEGAMSLDLAAQTAGWVETTIPTVAGAVYTVSFESYAGQRPNVGLLRFGSSPAATFSPSTVLEAADAVYDRFGYPFAAGSDFTVVRFEAASTDGFGPVIDNISVRSGNVVTEPTDAALRAALAWGGTVTFACDGRIVLTNTLAISADTELDATGHAVTLDGNGAVRILQVRTNVNLSLRNLTLANGRAAGTRGTETEAPGVGIGGAILNDGGTVNLVACMLTNNVTVGGHAGNTNIAVDPISSGGPARGGAIYSSGSLRVTDSAFEGNAAVGGQGGLYWDVLSVGRGGDAFGGAIYNVGKSVVLARVNLHANQSRGGLGSELITGPSWHEEGSASGGGLCSSSGSIEVQDCAFRENRAEAPGSPIPACYVSTPGSASGGAIHLEHGFLTLTATRFITNVATRGQTGAKGGSGQALGGAVRSRGDTRVTRSHFQDNASVGDVNPYGGGLYAGGAIHSEGSLTIEDSTFQGNQARSASGPGKGGAIYSIGSLSGVNCTLASNTAQSGESYHQAGPPLTFSALGGAVCVEGGSVGLTHVTLANNRSVGGKGWGGPWSPDGESLGANLATTNGTVTLQNTILAGDPSSTNCYGAIIDAGNNLSSDASCIFTNAGSLINTDPKLGPLGDYGGPTPTVPLLAGSPAIDAGNPAFCPPNDQRGQPRPSGPACDIGAFEFYPQPHNTLVAALSGSDLHLVYAGQTGESVRWLISTNLSWWEPVFTNTVGPDGLAEYADRNATRQSLHFFRTVSP